MAEFITFKRWSLKEGRQESELLAIVRDGIIPTYEKLPGCNRLELLHISGTRTYLATQHWESRAVRESVINSEAYTAWLKAYAPTLERWDAIMEFEDEWESEVLLDYDITP